MKKVRWELQAEIQGMIPQEMKEHVCSVMKTEVPTRSQHIMVELAEALVMIYQREEMNAMNCFVNMPVDGLIEDAG